MPTRLNKLMRWPPVRCASHHLTGPPMGDRAATSVNIPQSVSPVQRAGLGAAADAHPFACAAAGPHVAPINPSAAFLLRSVLDLVPPPILTPYSKGVPVVRLGCNFAFAFNWIVCRGGNSNERPEGQERRCKAAAHSTCPVAAKLASPCLTQRCCCFPSSLRSRRWAHTGQRWPSCWRSCCGARSGRFLALLSTCGVVSG